MNQVLLFGVLGLGIGGLYVLLALGVVLVHRSSGVINFAHGANAMAGTYCFWELNQNHHLPYWISLVAGMAQGRQLYT